jgi:hypothetical protein
MRPEHFHHATLPVRVPRGNDGFWQIICQLHEAQGTFTVADIDGESNVNIKMIQKYLRLLIAGGFVERAARSNNQRFVAPAYRLVKHQKRAPRVRADGSLIAPAIEHLWTAIRNLKTFGLKDLIFAATTPDVSPSYALAKRYATYLTSAGYLSVLQPKVGSRPQLWRLKPGMNTGPKPPGRKAINAAAMWDPNLGRFVGDAPLAREVSP